MDVSHGVGEAPKSALRSALQVATWAGQQGRSADVDRVATGQSAVPGRFAGPSLALPSSALRCTALHCIRQTAHRPLIRQAFCNIAAGRKALDSAYFVQCVQCSLSVQSGGSRLADDTANRYLEEESVGIRCVLLMRARGEMQVANWATSAHQAPRSNLVRSRWDGDLGSQPQRAPAKTQGGGFAREKRGTVQYDSPPARDHCPAALGTTRATASTALRPVERLQPPRNASQEASWETMMPFFTNPSRTPREREQHDDGYFYTWRHARSTKMVRTQRGRGGS